MFDSAVSKIARTVRSVARTIAVVTRKNRWLAPAAIVALLLFL